MKDRVSTKILGNGATRYGVYDEDGKLLRYEYIKLEDEPSTEGDFFNKANMLPDHIPALLGLKMENPQVKDALNVLANVGNLHVWERVRSLSEPTYLINSGDISLELYGDWYYSDSLTVASDLSLSLDSPSTINFSSSNLPSGINTIAGKFIKKSGKTDVYFCPVDYNYSSSIVGDYGYVSGITNAKTVIGQPAGTTTDYLTSTDRNAYPDESTDGSDAYYTLGAAGYLNFYYSENDGAVTWKYSSSISVDADGTVSLVSPSRTEMMADNTGVSSANNLKGKFVLLSAKSNYTDATHGVIYYIPADATISSQVSSTTPWYIQTNKAQPVTGHAAIPANTTITYLGQLGGGARIEVGSYVGTGTQGSENPTSLTFNFVPKMVIVTKQGQYGFALDGTFSSYSLFWIPGITYFNPGGSGSSSYADAQKNKITLSGKTLSWYRDSTSSNGYASHQLNGSGQTYQWIALG